MAGLAELLAQAGQRNPNLFNRPPSVQNPTYGAPGSWGNLANIPELNQFIPGYRPPIVEPDPPSSTTPTVPTGPNTIAITDEDSKQILENLLFSLTGIRGIGTYAFGLKARGFTTDDILNFLRYGNDPSPDGQRLFNEYQREYPGMKDFLQRGIFGAGIGGPEAEYKEYRQTVRQAAKAYGISDSLVDNNSIYNYINGNNSAAAIVSRMSTAAAAVATTPPATLAILKDYYNLSTGDLISFYLDTSKTEAELNKRLVSAQIGQEAALQSFGINKDTAENLVQRGYGAEQARGGFEAAAAGRSFTAGPGETASEEQLIGAQFGDTEAAKKISRISRGRAGGFEGGGAFAAGQQGISGLGTSSTS